MKKLDLINGLYKDYIESCILTNKEIDIKEIDAIYRHAEFIISKNLDRPGSIFRMARLENFKFIDSELRKPSADIIIKSLLEELKDYDFKKELKDKISPTTYKVLIEIVFLKEPNYETPT